MVPLEEHESSDAAAQFKIGEGHAFSGDEWLSLVPTADSSCQFTSINGAGGKELAIIVGIGPQGTSPYCVSSATQ